MRAIDGDHLRRWIIDRGLIYTLSPADILDQIDRELTIDPERQKGKWILVTDNNGQHYECDKCGEWKYHQSQKFCGECGADMRGEQI